MDALVFIGCPLLLGETLGLSIGSLASHRSCILVESFFFLLGLLANYVHVLTLQRQRYSRDGLYSSCSLEEASQEGSSRQLSIGAEADDRSRRRRTGTSSSQPQPRNTAAGGALKESIPGDYFAARPLWALNSFIVGACTGIIIALGYLWQFSLLWLLAFGLVSFLKSPNSTL
mmetsp:Transcript_9502/g.23791  ORF Transcript_9502/g.23791 Transcript_9502/m.23791 type:complete len:173 (+) Transcript_9502:40-558(+)